MRSLVLMLFSVFIVFACKSKTIAYDQIDLSQEDIEVDGVIESDQQLNNASDATSSFISMYMKVAHFNVSVAEIQLQEELNENVKYEEAKAKALTSIYADSSDEESPLSIVMSSEIEYSEDPFFSSAATETQNAQAWLRRALANNGEICLIPLYDELKGCFPAEHGEKVKNNWIFHLTIPSLSDHLYWIIVPRSDERAYNYGFN